MADDERKANVEAARLNEAGAAYYNRGEWPQSLECYEAALTSSRAANDQGSEATALSGMAGLYFYRLGQRTRALELYRTALALRQALGDRAGEAAVLFNLAGLLQVESQYAEARELLERLIELDRELDSPDLRSHKIVLGAVRRKLKRDSQG